jgi:hypothetical protein
VCGGSDDEGGGFDGGGLDDGGGFDFGGGGEGGEAFDFGGEGESGEAFDLGGGGDQAGEAADLGDEAALTATDQADGLDADEGPTPESREPADADGTPATPDADAAAEPAAANTAPEMQAVNGRVPVDVPENPALGRDATKDQFHKDLLDRRIDNLPEGPARDQAIRERDEVTSGLGKKSEGMQEVIRDQRETWRDRDGEEVLPELEKQFPGSSPAERQEAFDRAWNEELQRQNIPDARRPMDLNNVFDGARGRLAPAPPPNPAPSPGSTESLPMCRPAPS